MQLVLVTYEITAESESFSLFPFLFVMCHTLGRRDHIIACSVFNVVHVIIMVTQTCKNQAMGFLFWDMGN